MENAIQLSSIKMKIHASFKNLQIEITAKIYQEVDKFQILKQPRVLEPA